MSLLNVTSNKMHDEVPWILASHEKKECVHTDGEPPLVNITSLNISHVDYGRHGLESTGVFPVYSTSHA